MPSLRCASRPSWVTAFLLLAHCSGEAGDETSYPSDNRGDGGRATVDAAPGAEGGGARDAGGDRADGSEDGRDSATPGDLQDSHDAQAADTVGDDASPRDSSAGGPSEAEAGTSPRDPGTEGDGPFTVGPDYPDPPGWARDPKAPQGTVFHYEMDSTKSAIYPGTDPSLSHPGAFKRGVWVYVPRQYVDGSASALVVVQDGESYKDDIPRVLDHLIYAKEVPPIIAIMINPGPGDSRGSERGLEYDTVSDAYVRFIESEALPAVREDPSVRAAYPKLAFTNDPEGRSTLGCSSGGAAAFTMGWFRPDLYHRIVTYSGTFVNQHPDSTYPHSAWEYHEHLIAENPSKPLRVFLNVNETDLDWSSMFPDDMHNWRTANERMAAVLKSKNYHYRYVFGQNAVHCDGKVRAATLPATLTWMWRGYPIP